MRETDAVHTQHEREAKEFAAACRGRARAVLATADGLTCGITVAQHSIAVYNGAYRVVDERDGWPVLQNEHGIWLYRPSHKGHKSSNAWLLSEDHTPDVDQCNAYIDAPDGSFPIGEQSWNVWDVVASSFRPRNLIVTRHCTGFLAQTSTS